MFAKRYFPERFFTHKFFPPGTSIPAGCIVLRSGNLKVVLRCPEYGDTQKLDQLRISRFTRGNELKVYRDGIWTEQEFLRFQFTNLSTQDKLNLINFFRLTVGQDIYLKDYKKRTWVGTILTPNVDFVQDWETKCERYSTEFEFEGKRA